MDKMCDGWEYWDYWATQPEQWHDNKRFVRKLRQEEASGHDMFVWRVDLWDEDTIPGFVLRKHGPKLWGPPVLFLALLGLDRTIGWGVAAALLAVISIGILARQLYCVLGQWWRNRQERLRRPRGGSRTTLAKYRRGRGVGVAAHLSMASSALAYLIFSRSSPIADEFDGMSTGFADVVAFVSYQVIRVFTLDIVEIAGAAWTDGDPSTFASTAAVVALNVLISLGVLSLVVELFRLSTSREATWMVRTPRWMADELRGAPDAEQLSIDLVGRVHQYRKQRYLRVPEFLTMVDRDLIPESTHKTSNPFRSNMDWYSNPNTSIE